MLYSFTNELIDSHLFWLGNKDVKVNRQVQPLSWHNAWFRELFKKQNKGKTKKAITMQGNRSCVHGSPRCCGSVKKYVAQSRGAWKGFSEEVMSKGKPEG